MKSRGLTTIELVVVVGIMGVVFGILTIAFVNILVPGRRTFSQGQITGDARRLVERMGDEIRDAKNVDWNENGVIDRYTRHEQWLQIGDAHEIAMYTFNETVEGSPGAGVELTRYYLDGTNLMRETRTRPPVSGCFDISKTVLMTRSVQNAVLGEPLFSYLLSYPGGTITLTTPVADANLVDTVLIRALVDGDTSDDVDATEIVTEIVPRKKIQPFRLVGNFPECKDCIDNDIDGTADFAGVADMPGDPGCSAESDNNEHEACVACACDDGADNEDPPDGLIDFKADGSGDPQCYTPEDTTEDT